MEKNNAIFINIISKLNAKKKSNRNWITQKKIVRMMKKTF